MIIQNLLLIAGNGTNSGKTSMVCRIIESFPDLKITAIKITPHFHETTPGLILKSEKEGYVIYEETNGDSSKDTSRMIKAGAAKVYFAKVKDDKLFEAFIEIMKDVPEGTPVICESPALRNFVEPGIFVIMTSDMINKHKDIKHLEVLPHLRIKLEELDGIDSLPIGFVGGKWKILPSCEHFPRRVSASPMNPLGLRPLPPANPASYINPLGLRPLPLAGGGISGSK